MTQQRRTALKELQKLDVRIQEARTRIRDFDPRFEEIEEPALALESELGTSKNRLKEMKLEQRRLESSTEDKGERLRRLEERLGGVRNLREEAAVSAELDMVRRSLEGDESEAINLIDSVRKGEERVAELEAAFAEATAIVEPQKEALLAEREAAKAELSSLQSEREAFVSGIDPSEMNIYNAIRGNGSRAAVAELTEDGACGHCFGMVPLQSQNEIRHGERLIRCEACGVILAAPEPEPEGGEEPEAAADSDDASAAGDGGDVAADEADQADDAEDASGEAEDAEGDEDASA